jgi:hypothetical protein
VSEPDAEGFLRDSVGRQYVAGPDGDRLYRAPSSLPAADLALYAALRAAPDSGDPRVAVTYLAHFRATGGRAAYPTRGAAVAAAEEACRAAGDRSAADLWRVADGFGRRHVRRLTRW